MRPRGVPGAARGEARRAANAVKRRSISAVAAIGLSLVGDGQVAAARLVSTEHVAAVDAHRPAATARKRLLDALARSEVAAELTARGIDVAEARARLAVLTDAELAALARDADDAPAGAYWLAPFFVASAVVVLLYVINRLDLIDRLQEAWRERRESGER